MSVRAVRAKLSTTVAPENYEYLTTLVQSGKAGTVAEAVDSVITKVRHAENRRRLEQATAAYFNNLSREALAEENTLSAEMFDAAKDIEFDRQP
jgi:hypothetical protein